MTKRAYTTRTGLKQFKPVCTADEMDSDLGFCLACGNEVYGVEPDAERYPCGSCDQHKVYGLEQLMLMGLMILKGGRE